MTDIDQEMEPLARAAFVCGAQAIGSWCFINAVDSVGGGEEFGDALNIHTFAFCLTNYNTDTAYQPMLYHCLCRLKTHSKIESQSFTHYTAHHISFATCYV